jgi:hypothetical protein
MHSFKYVSEDGHTIEFTPHNAQRFDVAPLGFEQLIHSIGLATPEFSFKILNANASCTITGLSKNGPLTVNSSLILPAPILVYGLVDGGWLPLPFAHKRVALLDRNVIIALEKENASGETSLARLTELLGLDTETLSPMLFALEGADRRPPTEFQMRVELNRAAITLRNFFPDAKIEHSTPRKRKALLRMVLDHADFRSRATRLLVQAAPIVVDRVKAENRQELENEVIRIARAEGVRIESLIVLALLSCIYDSRDALSTHRAATPGRAVLKPNKKYAEEDAYNALADMFFLELLLNSFEMFPDAKPVLYTRDVGLAALWAAIQPTRRVVTKLDGSRSMTTINFPLSKALFPSLAEPELRKLGERLLCS